MNGGVVVIGGGISGLATAHALLRRLGGAAAVTVLDSGQAAGGKIRTVEVAGVPVDVGPDAFLARAPELGRLIADLGLAEAVVQPLPGGAFVWSRGRLRPLPAGTAFGLPERLWPLVRSGLLSPAGTVRAGLDLVLPAGATGPTGSDPSVRDLVRPRFGREVYQRLVEPLIGGVHAGDPALLSARSTVPEIAALAATSRSLTLALRRRRAAAPATSGHRSAPLVTLDRGLGRLVEALVASVGPDRVVTGTPARGLDRGADGRLVVHTDRGDLAAGHVVLSTPAPVAAQLLGPLDAALAADLSGIPYVGVANATLAFPRAAGPQLPAGTGFLVPPVEREFLVGCTWLSGKWAYAAHGDVVLVRGLVGRAGDDRWTRMTDAEIVDGVRAAVARMTGLAGAPVDTRVQRWPSAMPQYVVGHAARLDRIDAGVARLRTRSGRVWLTGAAYRGVGLAGCVAQAERVAAEIAEEEAG